MIRGPPSNYPPPLQRPGAGPAYPQQGRPASTLPNSVPDAAAVSGYDPAAVRAANMARAEALAAQQREEAQIMSRHPDNEMNVRMQNMYVDNRSQNDARDPRIQHYPDQRLQMQHSGPPRFPGPNLPPPNRAQPPQHFFPENGPPIRSR